MSGPTELAPTPSQTVGPFFSLALEWPGANCLEVSAFAEQAISIVGSVVDGNREPVSDALIEIWHADVNGEYARDAGGGFCGAARTAVDAGGHFRFDTLKPGSVIDPGGIQAPHINLALFARGLMVHLHTRIYFAEEAAANANDRVLNCVPEERRGTLLAQKVEHQYRFDICLQGANETVFFDV